MSRRDVLSVGISALYVAFIMASMFSVFTSRMMRGAFTPDLGWLLEAGRYILEHRAIPSHDIFSWTFPDRAWVVYQWLFEVIVALADDLLGSDLLVRVFMLMVAAIYVFVPAFGRGFRQIPLFMTLLVGAIALLIVSINMSLRPMVVSALFLLIQYLVLRGYRHRQLRLTTAVFLIFPLYAVWANMHMGLALGLLSLLLMLAGDLLESRRLYKFVPAEPRVEGRAVESRAYLILLTTAVVASFLNPYGPGIYFYLLDLSLKHELNDLISELQSPDFHGVRMLLFLVLFGVFVLLMTRANRVFRAHEILHLLVFTGLTFYAARFVVWACLFYVLILPKAMYQQWMAVKDIHTGLSGVVQALEPFRGIVLLSLSALAMAMFLVVPAAIEPFRLGVCAPLMKGIEAYHKMRRPSDRLFNDPLIGSCTLVEYPGMKVFIDTRFDFYDIEFVVKTRDTLILAGDWKEFLEDWRIDTLMLSKTWPLAAALKETDAASLLYEDDDMVVLRKEGLEAALPPFLEPG